MLSVDAMAYVCLLHSLDRGQHPCKWEDGGGGWRQIVSRQIYCIQGRRYIDLFTLGDAFHIEASFASDLWEEGPPDNP